MTSAVEIACPLADNSTSLTLAADGPGGWPVVDVRPATRISLQEAVRRVLNSKRYIGSRNKATVKTWVYGLAEKARGQADGPVMYQRCLFVPPRLHPALYELADQEHVDGSAVAELPEVKRNRGIAKRQAVLGFAAFVGTPEGKALGRTKARERFVHERADHYRYRDGEGREHVLDLSERSLHRWETLNRKGGLAALCKDGRGGAVKDDLAADAVANYWALRNDPRKFKVKHCWRVIAKEASRRGWNWFGKYGACLFWDRRNRNDRALTLNQRGDLAYAQKSGPYLEIDPESFEPGECWVGDDTTCDLWVAFPDGQIARPVLSTLMDWRSRGIVGWRLAKTGNEHGILLAFRKGCDAFGPPSVVIADNGKNYSSYLWQGGKPKRITYRRPGGLAERFDGIFARLDIRASWAIPYNPNAKARLERWFGTLEDQLVRTFPSYCGSTPEDRPEEHADLVAKAVDFDVFVAALAKWIDVYHATPHSGEGMGGLTPLQVMATRTRKRVIPDEVRDSLLAAWPRPVSLGRNGVAIRVAGAVLRFGQFEPKLLALNPKTKLRVSYDPENLDSIVVWDMEGRYVCRAEANRKFNRSVNTEALREAMRQKARAKRALREAAKVGQTLTHLRDPQELAIEALARDAERRRKPDPQPPEGGLALVPVQSPFQGAPKASEITRRAVGAEAMDDARARLEQFNRRNAAREAESREGSAWDRLTEWAEGQELEAAHG
jgi:transposase InsO family protein